MTPLGLIDAPLVSVYLLGKPATGDLARPWKAASPFEMPKMDEPEKDNGKGKKALNGKKDDPEETPKVLKEAAKPAHKELRNRKKKTKMVDSAAGAAEEDAAEADPEELKEELKQLPMAEINSMSIKKLKANCQVLEVDITGLTEKKEMVAALLNSLTDEAEEEEDAAEYVD